MSYDSNPYYSPEKWNMEILCSLEDPAACYSFDTVVVWIDRDTDRLLGASDSGCSCPSPFEDYTTKDSLTEIATEGDFETLIGTAFAKYSANDLIVAKSKVRKYLVGLGHARAAVRLNQQALLETVAQESRTAGSGAEEDLMVEIEDLARRYDDLGKSWLGLFENQSTLSERVITLELLNDNYLTVIREQGEFIQSLRNAISAYTSAERTGRFG